MPMLNVDDNTFLSELSRFLPTDVPSDINPAVIETDKVGRGKGNNEVPESLRKIIGETALIENNKETARAFGISTSSVSAYKKGAHSTASYNEPVDELKSYIDETRKEISTKARKKLLSAIDSITSEKLEEVGVKVASQVARDMSTVIKNIEPEMSDNNKSGVQFVFFAPHMREERDFPSITVNE